MFPNTALFVILSLEGIWVASPYSLTSWPRAYPKIAQEELGSGLRARQRFLEESETPWG